MIWIYSKHRALFVSMPGPEVWVYIFGCFNSSGKVSAIQRWVGDHVCSSQLNYSMRNAGAR